MQVTWVQSLDWEDPLEKGTAISSSILAWRIPWTEEPGGLQSMRSQKGQTQLTDFLYYYYSSYTEELEFEPMQSDFRFYNYNHYIVKW